MPDHYVTMLAIRFEHDTTDTPFASRHVAAEPVLRGRRRLILCFSDCITPVHSITPVDSNTPVCTTPVIRVTSDHLDRIFIRIVLVRAPADSGGRTTLCDIYQFLETLSAEERQTLAQRRYRFVSGIEDTSIERSAYHPMIEEREGLPPIVRFSIDFVEADPFLRDINQRLLRYDEHNHVAVAFETNALLVFDNLRMVHGRTGYQDRRRQLRRIWLVDR